MDTIQLNYTRLPTYQATNGTELDLQAGQVYFHTLSDISSL
jgi:hypothetical protein